ncbi:MAG: pyrroline-5-carboxylate reductase [Clostridium sp.]|uniref:pyrroline-5-carboxylate reductase n=1 Tax=Clostridium sp. TaxID=1506 RepID=UPI00290883FE|nr:pyrroline-5-carboxylate reductase [Clostridium sp.]MDU7337201.1 pyrroline-5-carboxylate reductase [Clostridium sp.]
MVVGFIGAGNMAGAIMNGILRAGIHPAQDMIVFDISEEKRSEYVQKGLRSAVSAAEVVKNADIVFLAVKPQNFAEVLEDAKLTVSEKTLFVTIAAGISIHYIASTLGCNCPVIRAMPNTPLLVGKGATALCRSEQVKDEDFSFVRSIFEACGTVEILREDQINVATSVNGSGPAYVYLFAKAAAESADRQGIPADAALRLFSQTLIGSAEMLLHSGHTPEELIKMVSSPGGTTLKALDVFYNRGFEAIVDEAMLACTHRAEELGK